MTDAQTTILYALSTLAQTCAALAAFVGTVGLFRLQILRDERNTTELLFRQEAERLLSQDVTRTPLQTVFERIDTRGLSQSAAYEAAGELRARLGSFPQQVKKSRCALALFEAWNLFVIGAALAGFNYVPALAVCPWTFWVLWVAAVGTVVVTGYCVFVWTKG